MTPTEMITNLATGTVDTVSTTADTLRERIDTDALSDLVTDIAVGEMIASAVPNVDVVSEQLARTARRGWRARRTLLIAALAVATIGVALVVVKRRRAGAPQQSAALDSSTDR